MEQINLKNNVEKQREYLNKNLEQLNTVVSAVLGVRVNLKVTEYKDYRKEIHFGFEDKHNFRDVCGIMAKAFSNVSIEDFGLWWEEDSVNFRLHFTYNHVNGGMNSAEFCRVKIENNFVKIL